MPKDVDYCVNHHDVAATGSCAHCGRKICYNCQVHFFGKIYCSRFHLLQSLPKNLWTGMTWLGRRIRQGAIWLYRNRGKVPKRSWVELVLALGLVFFMIQVLRLKQQVGRLARPPEKIVETPVDTTGISAAKPFVPGKGGMVSTNRIDISGLAEENRMVSLSVDGRLARVLLPESGRFEFKGVLLHRGQNKVEVRAITPEGDVSILQTLLFNYGIPMLSYLLKDFSRGPLDRKEVAFTFDGGSINNAAEDILNSLREKGVKCTFFLTGEFIQRYPVTVRRIVADGHDAGNHTWGHPHLTSFADNRTQTTSAGITADRIRMELTKTAALFRRVTGKDMVSLWRAPYGEVNPEILRWAAEAGFKHVGWTTGRGWEDNMDTMDWVADKASKTYHSADDIAAKILGSAVKGPQGINGAVILMHLGSERRDDFPHRKLPEILDGLKNNGYRAVKIADMLSERP